MGAFDHPSFLARRAFKQKAELAHTLIVQHCEVVRRTVDLLFFRYAKEDDEVVLCDPKPRHDNQSLSWTLSGRFGNRGGEFIAWKNSVEVST